MANKELVDSISEMDWKQVFQLIREYPEYLTDPYYRVFGSAIDSRMVQLLRENP